MSERLSLDNVLPLNDTPTSTKVSNSNRDSAFLDDINYLLYLETLKRFKEEEINLRRQVDEKKQQYEDAKAEYGYMFELYVKLYEEAVVRELLENGHSFPSGHTTKAAISDVLFVEDKLSNNKKIAYLDPNILHQSREILHGTKNHDNTQEMQTEMMKQKAAVKDIRSLNEAIQLQLEVATTQSLDYFMELLQADQKDNLIIPDRNECETHLDA